MLSIWFGCINPVLINYFSRAYFNESPVEVVKEQDTDLNKLATDAIIPSMPGHVVQAFTLLKSSPEAQVCNCIILFMLCVTCFSCCCDHL